MIDYVSMVQEAIKCRFPLLKGVYYHASLNDAGYKRYVFARTIEDLEKRLTTNKDPHWNVVSTQKIMVVSPNQQQFDLLVTALIDRTKIRAKSWFGHFLRDYYTLYKKAPVGFTEKHYKTEDAGWEASCRDSTVFQIYDGKQRYIKSNNKNLINELVEAYFPQFSPTPLPKKKCAQSKAPVSPDGLSLWMTVSNGYDGDPYSINHLSWNCDIEVFFCYVELKEDETKLVKMRERVNAFNKKRLKEEEDEQARKRRKAQEELNKEEIARGETAKAFIESLVKKSKPS